MKICTMIGRMMAAVALPLIAVPALAADIDPVIYVDDANFAKPAELGSGWYIRGDIGFNFAGRHDVSVVGDPARSVYETNNFMDKTHFSVGAGYRLNSFLRFEGNIGRLQGSDFSTTNLLYLAGSEPPGTPAAQVVQPTDANPCNGWGEFVDTDSGVTYLGDDFIRNCIGTDRAEYDSVYAMANAYFDLPTMAGFMPYVGGGIGFGRIAWRQEIGAVDCVPRAEDIRLEGCRAFGVVDQPEANEPYSQPGTVDNGVNYRLGWELAAGVGYKLADNVTLDASYRYKHFGASNMNQTDGASFAANGFGTHQINVGLRYELW